MKKIVFLISIALLFLFSYVSFAQGYADYPQEVLRLVNKERERFGLRPMYLANDLLEATSLRAEELKDYFSHTRPNGSDCFTVLGDKGMTCGENIAAGQSTPEAVMETWMNSPGHRSNILNPKFSELGVGYSYAEGSEYKHYWVQIFRGR